MGSVAVPGAPEGWNRDGTRLRPGCIAPAAGNLIGGGYSAPLASSADQGLITADARRNFSDPARAIEAPGCLVDRRAVQGDNGGFLPFLGLALRCVGMSASEWHGQDTENATLSPDRRQIANLPHASPWAALGQPGGTPPNAARRSHRALAREIFRNFIRFSTGRLCQGGENADLWSWQNGPGCRRPRVSGLRIERGAIGFQAKRVGDSWFSGALRGSRGRMAKLCREVTCVKA
jgi:hypothetical protein